MSICGLRPGSTCSSTCSRLAAPTLEPPAPPLLQRIGGALATPLTNAWKSRRDLAHWQPWPKRADTILLGDGVSLDRIDGAWRDRHGEPVMTTLERQARTTFLMQPGGLERLPWGRPTFAANTIAVRGALGAALGRGPPADLPDHAAVLDALQRQASQRRRSAWRGWSSADARSRRRLRLSSACWAS